MRLARLLELRTLVTALACAALMPVWADGGERGRLAAERKALLERFGAEERACASRFAVTACVDDVRARRRAEVAPLRDKELRLDEAERTQRADSRRAAIAAKQAAAVTRPPVPQAPPAARVRAPTPAASAPQRAVRPPADTAARAAEAAARVQEAQARRGEAQATRQRIEERQAQREASGRKSEPLPVPAAPGSAPR